MAAMYYYLVSGLPDIIPSEETRTIDWQNVFSEIREQLSNEHAILQQYLLLQSDNTNLINAICRIRSEKTGEDFSTPSYLSAEEINNWLKNNDRFPAYMIRFIEENSEVFAALPRRELARRLAACFLEETSLCGNEFITEYFIFKTSLKNIAAAYNCRQYGFDPGTALAGDLSINEILKKSTAPDFGLSQEFPFIPSLQEAFESRNPRTLENRLIDIEWHKTDELSLGDYFGISTVLAYTAKLLIVKRLLALDPEAGRKRLETLLSGIKQGCIIPAV
ncbi:MAG: hypothetical protein A2096_03415 [Spirochaetes bacterium GWF1_41_5]|nr:MAG: hypothetical protein A2096_03415 [Spirochaetes bacterium GWF1_41_5]